MDSISSSSVNKLFSGGGIPALFQRTDEIPQEEAATKVAPASPSSKEVTTDKPVHVETDHAKIAKTTEEQTIAPAVEHETVKHKHKEVEQTVIEKERHQDHYVTTVQPLKDREVAPTEHEHVEETHIVKKNHDDEKAKAAHEQGLKQFHDTHVDLGTEEKKTKNEAIVGAEHVHHHLHETIQPVIEKEVIVPSITHKTVNVKEVHQEHSEDHGVVTNKPISVEEFQKRLEKQ